MSNLYVSLGTVDSYNDITHVDAVRWTELYKGFNHTDKQFDKFDLLKYKLQGSVSEAIDRLRGASTIFVHHEAAVKELLSSIGKDALVEIISSSTSFLQMDYDKWAWLGLDSDEFIPLFDKVCTASASVSLRRNIKHIPLGCFKKDSLYNKNSNKIVYVGRYQIWFNERFEKLINLLSGCGYSFRIITYPNQIASISENIKSHANVEILEAVGYNDLNKVIGQAQFGIAFRNGDEPNGKVWDYISAGLPVIYEHGISEDIFLESQHAGVPISINDTDFVKSIQNYEYHCFENLIENNNWEKRALTWTKEINN